MSSISKSVITRRRLLLSLAAWPLASLAATGPETLTAGFRRWGSGEFRRFGFLVYEATLWAGGDDPLRPPLALKLTYKRNISGRDIADASVKEIRNLGVGDEARLKGWGEQMASIFPDVRPGDHILGVQLPDEARFFFNDRSIGTIDDPAFARAFFAIWLDAKTSAPDLRAALLKRQAS
ncbi:MAG: chalcone isomerase family protein [Dechloromonas sp.]|uniref:Chalcone isomerase family protein n=1 Tax=Candidatus Dechloromonas phosphorivorans TaxID=2899244 RepID=A0A9D7LQH0_9RHOO|nr:chalcone isomerase family protein [Candidatus Dechloromonas phosphorivorans]